MKKLACLFALIIITYFQAIPAIAQNPVRVYVSDVSRSSVAPMLELSGEVEFPEISGLACEVSGVVDKIHFDEGDKVRRGEALLSLNSDIAEKDAAALEAMYKSAEEDARLRKWEFERYDTLYIAGDVPEREKRIRETEYLKCAHAAEKLKAECERAKLILDKMTLRAPFDGIILKKLTHTGCWLEPGTPAAVIASSGKIDIVCNVPQSKFASVSVGDLAKITTDGGTFEGRVFAKIPRGDANSRTYPIKIRVDNTMNLAAGMEVNVALQCGKPRQSVIVPRDAVVARNDSYYIYAIDGSNAREIQVEVVSYQGVDAEVKSPKLDKYKQVVVRGNRFLTDGQLIDIAR